MLFNELTLVIPAKEESFSLPRVLNEIKNLNLKKIIILPHGDFKTLSVIKNFDCKIVPQIKSGYGAAIIQGINLVKTKYVCIYYADGSTDPKYLKLLYQTIKVKNVSIVFCSRYFNKRGKLSGSKDDNFLTIIGNYFFTILGNLLFSLKMKDLLFTFFIAEVRSLKKLNLKSKNVSLCVEIPLKAKNSNLRYTSIPAFERKRFGGKKKMNELRDGLIILLYLLERLLVKFYLYLKNN